VRIVQVVTQMEAAGAQAVALQLGDGLRSRGHSVETWFLYIKRPAFTSLPHVRAVWPRPASAARYPAIAARLLAMLRAERPDAVISHTHYANVMGQAAAAAAGVRRRIAVQHNPVESYPAAARRMDRWLGSRGMYTATVCVSETVLRSVDRYPAGYRSRLRLILNGVGLPETASPSDARDSLPPGTALLVNVGRLAEQKNQGVILDAIAPLDGVSLAIAGEGECGEALRRKAASLGIAGRVRFMGEVTREAVAGLLAVADLFVFPSRFEAMGLAVVEAMLAGVPVVASDIPAMREVLGDAAVLVVPDDPHALRRAIQGLLDDPDRRTRLAAAARARAAGYSVERMVDRYEALLDE
jgi:glycosyltransferase involved in cell wall biosynthesis